MHKLKLVVLVLALFALPSVALTETTLKKEYTDDELIETLRNEGFRSIELTADRVISIKVDGLTFVLFAYEDDDLQLYFGVKGYRVDADDLNAWNQTRRLSRAYLDEENDAILEADLLANAGYTEEQFIEWFKVFNFSALEFRQFLIENDDS